ncbi:hypothetical protein B0O99DRAFT_605159 [Bisporella sp. PMI_857]|nr:hypothetical protein B0O99DRAFT_605159 [Bisporella sp. PMI_857]
MTMCLYHTRFRSATVFSHTTSPGKMQAHSQNSIQTIRTRIPRSGPVTLLKTSLRNAQMNHLFDLVQGL